MGVVYTLSNDHVAKYNIKTKFFDKIKIGNGNSDFYDFALDRSSDTLFISDCKNSMIYSYDTRHNVGDVIKSVRAPTLLGVSRDAPMLFVVSEISQLLALVNYKSIFVIDPRGHKVMGTLPSGRNPARFIASPDGRALYIIDKEKDPVKSVLYKIDVDNKKVTGSMALNGPADSMGIAPDGHMIYISMAGEDRIVAIDTNSLSVAADIQVRNIDGHRYGLTEIAVSPDGKKLYAATTSNVIAIIDLGTYSISGFIDTKFNARTMATDAVENMLYVACYLVDILVIDMLTDRIVKRMTLESGDIKKIVIGQS